MQALSFTPLRWSSSLTRTYEFSSILITRSSSYSSFLGPAWAYSAFFIQCLDCDMKWHRRDMPCNTNHPGGGTFANLPVQCIVIFHCCFWDPVNAQFRDLANKSPTPCMSYFPFSEMHPQKRAFEGALALEDGFKVCLVWYRIKVSGK